MSGHSKWATIKRAKGITDAKRGQAFTKLSNALTIAVKQGGGNTDPNFNASLRIAIDKAKAANMPKDGIERAIMKGSGAGGGSELFEVLYEGFAHGGVGLLVEAVTDKKQRTVAEVKSTLEKNGATMAGQGAVSYLFQRVGEIIITTKGNVDEILTIAMDCNITDYEEVDNVIVLYTDPTNLSTSKKHLEEAGLNIDDAGLIYRPNSTMSVDDATSEKILSLIEKLEDMDDVQKVYTNLL